MVQPTTEIMTQKTGVELIAEERQRQIEKEGWTPEHDDAHNRGELALASLCYVCPDEERIRLGVPHQNWPWQINYWKPTPDDRVRELVKAGALISAEIDRLQRMKS